MGEVVLDTGANDSDLHLYAHCLPDQPGGVGLVAINLSRTGEAELALSFPSTRYTLSSADELSEQVSLNGTVLALTQEDGLPELKGDAMERGSIHLAPLTISFFAIVGADNKACR